MKRSAANQTRLEAKLPSVTVRHGPEMNEFAGDFGFELS